MRVLSVLLFAVTITVMLHAPAEAQVRRCVNEAGSVIYTDRRCDELGAVERAPPARTTGATQRGSRCMRTVDDLVFEVESAVLANDANRLLGLYHWTGLSTSQAYAVVPRLDAIVQRPLVDVAAVFPAEADDYYPRTTARRGPVAIRIDQTLANGSTPVRTVFGLQRHFGCWWLRG